MTVSLLNAISPVKTYAITGHEVDGGTRFDSTAVNVPGPSYWQAFRTTMSNRYRRMRSWVASVPWEEILQFSSLVSLGLSYVILFLSLFGLIAFPWWASVYLVLWCGFVCLLSYY